MRQPDGTARERDGHDHRQQFRGEPNSQSQGKDQGLKPGPMERHALRHDQNDEHQRYPQYQHTELAQPDFEGCRRRLVDQRVGQLAKYRLPPGSTDELHGAAGDYGGPGQRNASDFADFGCRIAVGGSMLFHRVGFAREQCLVHEEITCRKEHPVGRDQIADGEQDDIARHELRYGKGGFSAVSPHFRPQRHLFTKRVDGGLSPALLNEVKQDREQHDRGDNDEAWDVARQGRKPACDQEDDDERVAKKLDEAKPAGRSFGRRCIVAAVAGKALFGLLRAQTGIGCRQFCQQHSR